MLHADNNGFKKKLKKKRKKGTTSKIRFRNN